MFKINHTKQYQFKKSIPSIEMKFNLFVILTICMSVIRVLKLKRYE